MKTIHITHPHNLKKEEQAKSVMALGYFDGVHLGHQKVIGTAKAIAEEKGLALAVMTFHPHPSHVLGREREPKDLITPLEDKISQIEQLGTDVLYVVKFNEAFASLTPEQFADQYIVGLNVQHAVAGFDFTYGKYGKGTMASMPLDLNGQADCTTVEKLTEQDKKISSSFIRTALQNGDVELAGVLLGQPYFIKGIIIHGDKRGRTIGFPTANVGLNNTYIVPPTGVYAVQAEINGNVYQGVCNIGYKPTFYEKRPEQPSIEVHLFDFDQEVYGESIKIKWYKRIRSERKFSGIAELTEQIEKDKQEAIRFFSKCGNKM
ncbi:bifunctional riboflavin kinase/FAD synthetase [Bacillus atrophaeus]|uniref:Riboflavin biosynthesis protein n=1 Tax=Bacillus atrophaeus (strain 1942) TaxID=720555 RepID=A0ABM5LWB9_BACA1|nr:bifunctional riboflavin kinase/FAD synthetase [Bacillus atrophaeus]AMR62919.1 bifunctional riboflavin kinase/FMN adenylyltransferase [Bacillus subtilis subsp. globigii]ADP32182.1 bifunctional riboflavin kinase/FMN adenylyltransferase [Bacillus atrophaeus 1942]AIK47563.1 riboflavin biosynthesis protein RibF [Bacillus atrophaeus subsp. globigii]EIM08857.1 bifunctional riboflavin kinase/FMN adenylyltransferase [Bacillus atrophaeus C89]KFK81585.1 riboflavin biosynthesis protein RibF [Bacillus a